jgi:hypothetical protein
LVAPANAVGPPQSGEPRGVGGRLVRAVAACFEPAADAARLAISRFFKNVMDHFSYRQRVLHCEDAAIPSLVEKFGTPLYVYSRATLLHHLKQIQTAFAELNPLICYSVKTNGNINLGRLMAEHGSGFDVTSGGELFRALKAGGVGPKIVFAGVGKTDAEIQAALENDVLLFNVESEGELSAIGDVATKMGRTAQVALRVNPDLPPKTHIKTDIASRASSSDSTSTRCSNSRGRWSATQVSGSSACTCIWVHRFSRQNRTAKASRKDWC